MDQERAAADTRRLGFDQAQHHFRGDGRIQRIAATAQDVSRRFGG